MRAADLTSPPLVKSLAKNGVKFDEGFSELCYCYDSYKNDVLANESISEDIFNEDEEAKYQFNDKQMDDTRKEYYQLVDKSDIKLDELVPVNTSKKEDKMNLEN